jgi:hypothetical protein
MTRWLHLLFVALSACSFVHDFDAYDYESDAAHEDGDPRGKPRRTDGGPELAPDGETGPGALEDGAQAAIDAGDGQAVVPAPDAAQGPAEAGSAPDAAARIPGPLEGAWDVELELLNEGCPGNARLELDAWQLARGAGDGAQLSGADWTLEGELSGIAESVGMFEGETPGYRWEVTLVRDGAELGGQLTRSELKPGGLIGCRVTRMVRGTR